MMIVEDDHAEYLCHIHLDPSDITSGASDSIVTNNFLVVQRVHTARSYVKHAFLTQTCPFLTQIDSGLSILQN